MQTRRPTRKHRYNRSSKHPYLLSAFCAAGIFTVLGALAYDAHLLRQRSTEDMDTQLSTASSGTSSPKPSSSASLTPKVTAVQLPSAARIEVPFIFQAPTGNWNALYEDACEETSLLMVNHFLNGTKPGDASAQDAEVASAVHAGEELGQGHSITLEQLRLLANSRYQLSNGSITSGKDVTVESIKSELVAGNPVIIPAAGKLLPNPYFKNGEPNYHMLVLVGYDAEDFIANDTGISKGKDFRYGHSALLDAIHDWDEANILNGRKAYLTFSS